MTQTSLFEDTLRFGGKTYEPIHDEARLTGQLGRVKAIMSDGQWRTLHEIQRMSKQLYGKHDSEAAISARLRDFRKAGFGSHTVDTRRCANPADGLFEYRFCE